MVASQLRRNRKESTMKDIIKEIEYCSAKIKELKSKYNPA